jgi:uncharacterized protein
MLKVIKTADFRRMPWKNGAGETIEIAVSPPNADWSNFEWRVSMAQVTQSGPFSVFPEVDRTLLVLSGGQLTLTANKTPKPISLQPGSAPYTFKGEDNIHALLSGEPVLDFNVMTHRQRYRHSVKRHSLVGSERLESPGTCLLILVLSGGLSVECEASSTRVARMEALLSDQPVRVSAAQPSELIVVSLVAAATPLKSPDHVG